MNRIYLPVAVQLAVFSVTAVAIWFFLNKGFIAWVSGCALTIMCNVWFSFRSMFSLKVRSSHAFLAAANRGLVEKYLLAASGFAVIFVMIKPQTPLLVILSAVLMMSTHFVASVVITRRLNSNNFD